MAAISRISMTNLRRTNELAGLPFRQPRAERGRFWPCPPSARNWPQERRGAAIRTGSYVLAGLPALSQGTTGHDPQAQERRISALLTQEGSKDRQAPQPGHFLNPRRGREA